MMHARNWWEQKTKTKRIWSEKALKDFYEKPDPQIFKEASKRTEVPCQEMVHVGNLYEIDYLGAESAGLTSVLIDRKGKYKDKRCRKISNLTQMLNLLKEISGRKWHAKRNK
jgi:FMN phosphatase YigB (HAD superfamily)